MKIIGIINIVCLLFKKKFFIGIRDSMKNLQYPLNLSIAPKVLSSEISFFKLLNKLSHKELHILNICV